MTLPEGAEWFLKRQSLDAVHALHLSGWHLPPAAAERVDGTSAQYLSGTGDALSSGVAAALAPR